MIRRLAVFAVILACSCRTAAPAWMSMPGTTERYGIQVETEGLKKLSFWYKGITGTATNISGEDYSGCSIRYDALDTLGAKIGTALAECDEFKNGETWSFTANFAGTDVRDVEIVAEPVIRVRR